jgi:pimeloyl-ACP methyl ester carboxylesterase
MRKHSFGMNLPSATFRLQLRGMKALLRHFLMAICLALLVCGCRSALAPRAQQDARSRGGILSQPPIQPDLAKQYLFYLHGGIVEGSDGRPVSQEFGPYEYREILQRFADDGFTVISEIRPFATDPAEYGKKVAAWVGGLLKAGVPGRNVTVVGASQGGVIAAHVSALLNEPELKFVILAGLYEDVESERRLMLHGRVFSIYDQADRHVISPGMYFKQSPALTEGKSLVTKTGLGHGLVYQPYSAWYGPAVKWINQRSKNTISDRSVSRPTEH